MYEYIIMYVQVCTYVCTCTLINSSDGGKKDQQWKNKNVFNYIREIR